MSTYLLQHLFTDSAIKMWFSDNSRDVIASIISKADLDPEDFIIAYNEIMIFITDEQNWTDTETELSARGVMIINNHKKYFHLTFFNSLHLISSFSQKDAYQI